ncbi:hypothetical protein OKW21_000974 [Catalinimonas alkaloidigena]|uniref:hypothetical protein n=1 Tax=Catalinimonas alkaloidigena TaxID=1075417 RepID=UPI0024073CC5|nr:hypothetical protein [Catalinimonas alkaloidigena]MDF9795711.1 hypothetical protein [Catalinimonas alkaloidigena]
MHVVFIIKLQSLLLTIFFIIVLPYFSHGQHIDIDTLKYKLWSAHDSLQWSDFQKSPVEKELKYGFRAKTLTSLVYFYTPALWHIDSCMNVYVAVSRQNSFTKDTTDKILLGHERIHFDIAELFARYLRKEFIMLSQSDENTLEQYLSLRDSLFQSANVFQDIYDEETMYGLNAREQKKWTEYIDKELETWKGYTFDQIPQHCKKYITKNEGN